MRKRAAAAVLCVLALWAQTAQALDFIGPPTAGLDAGKLGAGFTYYMSDEEVEFEGTTLDDFETTRYYGWIGYGVTDRWEVYTRLGVINVDIDDLCFDESDFIAVVGTKVTLVDGEALDWGAAAQVGWTDLDGSFTCDLSDLDPIFPEGTQDYTGDMEFHEVQVAVGPVLDLGGLQLYGGPFWYWYEGEIDIAAISFDPPFDLEEGSEWGGYGGVIVDLGSDAALVVEGTLVEDGWGWGASIGWEF